MKRFLVIILPVLLLLLTACNLEEMELSDTIKAPENLIPPLYGEWIIKDYKISSPDLANEEMAQANLGKKAIFHNDLAAIGEEFCTTPLYKIKNVKAIDYLIYQYKTNPKFLDIDKEEIQVISISGEDKFFYEFIRESEDRIIAYIDNIFYYLELDSEKVEEINLAKYYYNEKAMLKTMNLDEKELSQSSILIGLKSIKRENEDNIEDWNYRTLLINMKNKRVMGIYEMEDIFFPRKNGFWKLEVDREKDNNLVEDKIRVYPLKKPSSDTKSRSIKKEGLVRVYGDQLIKPMTIKRKLEHNLKHILYVGNDYISIESVKGLEKGRRVLEFYPIDNLAEGTPIKIGDIAGENGRASFLEEAKKELLAREKDLDNIDNYSLPNEESFGLFRRNGHWTYRGRINFSDEVSHSYKDFNIHAIPSKEVVHYDKLNLPWNGIKTKVPEAVDAFTSPNEDIVLIITHSTISIYSIENGFMGDLPLEKIQLKPTEKVIMLEWGVDRYGPLWQEEFIKNGGARIFE